MNNKTIYIHLIIYLVNFVLCENKDKLNSENEEFVATNEWQVIREGQAIPQGLHVRINLQTGLKEAKLLDAKEQAGVGRLHKNEDSNALLEIKPPDNVKGNKEESNSNYSPDELKKILKNIKSDENLPLSDKDEIKRVKEKFKNYEELKKEMSNLNMSVKTDAEILHELFQEFKDISLKKNSKQKDEVILDILEQFEYFVHQIDNANEFIKNDGIIHVIYKNLNNTNSKLRSEALKILGSCVQNNPSAQIKALESEAVDKVLRLLATEIDYDVKKRSIFALSSLLRRFPYAQQQFIKNGGFKVFSHLFSKPEDVQLQYKIITLLYDLLIEQKSLDCSSESETCEIETDVVFEEKLKQYKSIDLKSALGENNWCTIFTNTLLNNANIEIEDQDHDAIERILNLMKLVENKCYSKFKNQNLINLLTKLSDYYFKLSEIEVDNNVKIYYNNLFLLTHKLLANIGMIRTEL